MSSRLWPLARSIVISVGVFPCLSLTSIARGYACTINRTTEGKSWFWQARWRGRAPFWSAIPATALLLERSKWKTETSSITLVQAVAKLSVKDWEKETIRLIFQKLALGLFIMKRWNDNYRAEIHASLTSITLGILHNLIRSCFDDVNRGYQHHGGDKLQHLWLLTWFRLQRVCLLSSPEADEVRCAAAAYILEYSPWKR